MIDDAIIENGAVVMELSWEGDQEAEFSGAESLPGGIRWVRPDQCLIADFDGASYSIEWMDALWASFSTAALQRQRRSVERYNRA